MRRGHPAEKKFDESHRHSRIRPARGVALRGRAGRERYRGPVLPLIPGVDCAGVVDAVGPGVGRWRAGDRVAAAGTMPLDTCAEDGSGYKGPRGMMGIKRPGGFAELVAVPACAGVPVPDRLDFHHAAVVMRHVPTAWN